MEPDLTAEDAAKVLRLNPVTVLRMLSDGRLTGYKVGRRWRITEAALNEFRLSGKVQPVGRPRKPVSDVPKRPKGRPRKTEEKEADNE